MPKIHLSDIQTRQLKADLTSALQAAAAKGEDFPVVPQPNFNLDKFVHFLVPHICNSFAAMSPPPVTIPDEPVPAIPVAINSGLGFGSTAAVEVVKAPALNPVEPKAAPEPGPWPPA